MQQITRSAGKIFGELSGNITRQNLLTQFGLWGVSSGLLSYAFGSRRPISSVADENLLRNGVVKKIEPTEQGPLLLVNHELLSANGTKQVLPIKVAGVHIDGNGFSWLQMLITGKEIRFIPFNINDDECSAKVLLVEKNKGDLDIGRALVSLGFARAVPFTKKIESNIDSASVEKYLKQLRSSEVRAKALRKGLWSFLPESWLRWKIRTTIEKLVFDMKPLDKKIPALVR